jgi:cob(I)alamin adenosyltransferase
MSRLYTGTGDGGQTSLLVGGRISKADPRVESYGTVDELNVAIGLARVQAAQSIPPSKQRDAMLETLNSIQDALIRLAADLASGGKKPVSLCEQDVSAIEGEIDSITAELPALSNFLLPGVTSSEITFHQCRVVCRRAERRVAALPDNPPHHGLVYLNRLSDLMFTMARLSIQLEGASPRVWRPAPKTS